MTVSITRSPMRAVSPGFILRYRVRPFPYGVGWWVTRDNVPINWFPTWARAINEARARNAAARLRREREEQS